jgi:hypothetical protein
MWPLAQDDDEEVDLCTSNTMEHAVGHFFAGTKLDLSHEVFMKFVNQQLMLEQSDESRNAMLTSGMTPSPGQ